MEDSRAVQNLKKRVKIKYMELPFKLVFQFEIFPPLYCLCDEVSMKCGNKKT